MGNFDGLPSFVPALTEFRARLEFLLKFPKNCKTGCKQTFAKRGSSQAHSIVFESGGGGKLIQQILTSKKRKKIEFSKIFKNSLIISWFSYHFFYMLPKWGWGGGNSMIIQFFNVNFIKIVASRKSGERTSLCHITCETDFIPPTSWK